MKLIRNTWRWNPDYSSRNPESEIQVPLTKTVRNSVPSIRNPWVEFRIQECLGFPHTGEQEAHKWFFAELISGKEGYIPPRAYFLIPLYPLSWTATANTLSSSHEINEQLLKTELILLIRGWNNTQDLRWLTKMSDPCFWKSLRTVKNSSLLRQGRKTVGEQNFHKSGSVLLNSNCKVGGVDSGSEVNLKLLYPSQYVTKTKKRNLEWGLIIIKLELDAIETFR